MIETPTEKKRRMYCVYNTVTNDKEEKFQNLCPGWAEVLITGKSTGLILACDLW